MQHSYIGTEHLLLGLLREKDGVTARVLGSFGMTTHTTRTRVTQLIRPGDHASDKWIPFTPSAKRAFEETDRESTALDDAEIRPEHLLLGILDVYDGISSR